MADLVITSTYIKGLRAGEAFAKTEDGNIIAKGIYKNGKPFKGTFVVEEEGFDRKTELINVENFKRTGLQKVFNYRLDNLEKTYTVENEKLNGITTFYDDGKVAATLDYRDDQPYSGTLVGEKESTTYNDGKIERSPFMEANIRQMKTILLRKRSTKKEFRQKFPVRPVKSQRIRKKRMLEFIKTEYPFQDIL